MLLRIAACQGLTLWCIIRRLSFRLVLDHVRAVEVELAVNDVGALQDLGLGSIWRWKTVLARLGKHFPTRK